MKLSYIEENPDDSLDRCERRVNNGSRSNFTEKFLPKIGNPFTCARFNISVLKCATERLAIYGKLSEFCLDFYGEGKIFVHPDLAEYYPDLSIHKTRLVVTPTSSSRTVKLLSYPYYLKLCYPDRIGRVTRELDERHINSSLDVTESFERIALHQDASEKFVFMPELGGVLFTGIDGTRIGVVVRSKQPRGRNASTIRYLIPGFSLFSTDRDAVTDEPLLLQLFREKCSESKEDEYLLNEFCYPLIDIFFNCVMLEGIVPEMHSQNILMGFDEAWNLKGIVLRDLESHDKDISLMKLLGKMEKPRSYPFKCIEDSQYNYAIKHSFMFDHKLGEYFIYDLIELVAKGDKRTFDKLCSILKDYVLENYGHFINDVNFFPSDGKWYKFENVVVDRQKTSRPYVGLDNPLFR